MRLEVLIRDAGGLATMPVILAVENKCRSAQQESKTGECECGAGGETTPWLMAQTLQPGD